MLATLFFMSLFLGFIILPHTLPYPRSVFDTGKPMKTDGTSVTDLSALRLVIEGEEAKRQRGFVTPSCPHGRRPKRASQLQARVRARVREEVRRFFPRKERRREREKERRRKKQGRFRISRAVTRTIGKDRETILFSLFWTQPLLRFLPLSSGQWESGKEKLNLQHR